MKVILLAAGRGRRFGKRTVRLPKCLIPLSRGEDLLSRYLDSFRALKLRDVVLVVGHEKDRVIRACIEKGRGLSVKFLFNPRYEQGSIVSLFTAAHELTDDCLIMDADVYFQTNALGKLLKTPGSAFLLDPRSKSSGEEMMVMAPATKTSAGRRSLRPCRISKRIDPRLCIIGEAVGFLKLKRSDALLLSDILEKMVRQGKTGLEYEEAYNELMKTRRVGFKKITGFWTEMDFEEDWAVIARRAAPKQSM